jgi:6-phosphofructokinase 1
VTGILRLGGTMLGTVNRGDPSPSRSLPRKGTFDYSDRVVEMFGQMELDALVCIGGDGTLAISYEFYKKGIPLVCVPKTIDNDIVGTTSCFGFDTAVSFATDAIDRLALDRRSASPNHGGRGDGPLRRMDRATQRHGRRRGC